MSTTRSDELIEQYLERLTDAAASLPATDRNDLIADIREHIAVALQEEEQVDETTIRNLLDRLGDPEDVVEAASVGSRPEPAPVSAGGIETAALLALTLSPLAPGLGWVLGAVLVGASRTWTRHSKLVALVGIPLGAAVVTAGNFVSLPYITIAGVPLVFPPILHLSLLAMGPVGAAYLAPRRAGRLDATDGGPATGGPLAWAAVVMLLLSWALPLLGWAVGAALAGISRSWTQREKVAAIIAIPLATVVAGAALPIRHLPGLDLPISGPLPVSTLPVFTMGPIGAAYLAWRLVARLRAHRSLRARDDQRVMP